MTQRIPKINVMGVVAMCATFWVSALLVHGFRAKSALNPFHPKTASQPIGPVSESYAIPAGMIRHQPDAPIKFVGLDTTRPRRDFAIVAKNVSGRPITAFALMYSLPDSKVQASLSTYTSSTEFPTSLDVNSTYSWALAEQNVKEVWVDFVEFSDGTIWGENTNKTLESMNAGRIGARNAAQIYSWTLRTRGPQAMLDSFPEPITNTMIEAYPEVWRSAYQSAVELVCAKLLRDKANVEIQMNAHSGDAFNKALTERFNRTLQSYINFRH